MPSLVRACAAVLAAVLAVLGLTVPAGPAAAKSAPRFDVVSLSMKDMVVSRNSGCPYSYVHLKSRTNVRTWDFHTRMTKGRTVLRIADTYPFSYPYADFDSRDHPRTARIGLCPYNKILGKITIGPGHAFLKVGSKWIEKRSEVKGYFYIRAKSSLTASSRRSGSTVRVSAQAKRFNVDWQHPRYVAYSPKRAQLQVKSGRGWKTVQTRNFSHGRAHFSVKQRGKRAYRVAYPRVSWATGAATRTFTR